MSGIAPHSTSALQRRLGLWSATALVVSNMIGTGIFTTTGFLAGDLGQPWLVLGIWVVIAAFVLLGLFAGQGSWEHFSAAAERTSTSPLLQQFAVSLFWVMFGYSGWNAATYVAEEIRDPKRTLPRALIFGTVTVALLYLALNVTFIFGTPLEAMKGVVAVGAMAASSLFGPQVAGVFGALMALAIVSTVNAMVTIGPRVYYAMAKDGAFLGIASRVSPGSRVPIVAVLFQGACAVLMTFTSFPQLVIYIGFSLTFVTVLAVSSLFVFRPSALRFRSCPRRIC